MENTEKRGVARKHRGHALHESPVSLPKTSNGMSNCRDMFSPKSKAKSKNTLGMRDTRSPNFKLSSVKDVGGNKAEAKNLHLQGQKRKIQEPQERKEDQENQQVCENNQSLNIKGSAEKRQKVMGTGTCSPSPSQTKKLSGFGTPTRNEKGNQSRGNKGGKSNIRERGVGTRSPAWMQHSPRPACCMSPIRKPGTPWRECQLRKLKEEQLAEKAKRKNARSASTSVKPDTSHCVDSLRMNNEVKDEVMAQDSQQTSLEKTMETMKPSATAPTPCQDSAILADGKINIEMMTKEDDQNCEVNVPHVTNKSPNETNSEMMILNVNKQKQAASEGNSEKTAPNQESANLDLPFVNINQSDNKAINRTDPDCKGFTSMDDGSAVDGKVQSLTLTRSPLAVIKDRKEDIESPKSAETAMSRFKTKMSRSYQKTMEYFKEVKNIWDGK
ncbi:uncharacterized protein LOC135467692 [Liolophura sinensis]|uniref:uncharacterized protein LOC135467692 n=1 Tax=Liolophura sinensis TaxID=3198878 RepID=UPI0031590897